MAEVIIIGVTGEDGLWLADLKAGTISPLEADKSGELGKVAGLRKQGASVVKGVDFAVAVASAGDVATSLHEG